MIQTIVERIYIVDKDDERFCHIFIKGCSGEDYTGFFQTAGYIEQKTTPVCDSEQYCITSFLFDGMKKGPDRFQSSPDDREYLLSLIHILSGAKQPYVAR